MGLALAKALRGVADPRPFPHALLDVADAAAVRRAFDAVRPDVVFHAAGLTDVDRAEREPELARLVHEEGTAHVAQACAARGALLVAVSTDYVFDGTLKRPYREEDPPHPLSVYGRTKLGAEEAIRRLCPDHLIVRSQGIYGDGRNHLVSKLLASRNPGAEWAMVEDRVNQPTLADDLAEALVALWRSGARGTFHVANRGPIDWYRFGLLVKEMTGLPAGRIRPVRSAERAEAAPRPPYSVLDVARYETATGRRMRTVREALADYLARVTRP